MTRLARSNMEVLSRQLQRQAIWCGTVVGLFVLFTTLNCLPPLEIYYQVSGKILASPERTGQLQDHWAGNSQNNSVDPGQPKLTQLKVLDQSGDQNNPTATSPPAIALVSVGSIWNSRCDSNQFQHWIDQLSLPNDSAQQLSNTNSSSELTLAKWQLDAAIHYQARHEHLGDRSSNNQTNGPFQLASMPLRDSQPPQADASNSEPNFQQIQAQLAAEVQLHQSQIEKLSSEQSNRRLLQAGGIALTDGPTVSPRSRPARASLVISVLILGIAAGACAGWLQSRLHSGGAFEPRDVSLQLSSIGIPEVAALQLESDAMDESDWIASAAHSANSVGRTSGRNLILLAEAGLGFWVLLIIGRLMIDSFWRHLLLESPLAALGRLLSGMP